MDFYIQQRHSRLHFFRIQFFVLEPVEVGVATASREVLAAEADKRASELALTTMLVRKDTGVENFANRSQRPIFGPV